MLISDGLPYDGPYGEVSLRTTHMAMSEDVSETPPSGRRHEVLGILGIAGTLLLGLSLWSYDAIGGENWIGPVGATIGGIVAAGFGVAAWVLPVELGLLTIQLFRERPSGPGLARLASTLITVLVTCSLLHLALPDAQVFGGHMAGGAIGEVLGEVLKSLLGFVGAFVVGLAILLITLVLRTPVSVIGVTRKVATGTGSLGAWLWRAMVEMWHAWKEAKAIERAEADERKRLAEPKIVIGDEDRATHPDGLLLAGAEPEIEAPTKGAKAKAAKAAKAAKEPKKPAKSAKKAEPVDEDEGADEESAFADAGDEESEDEQGDEDFVSAHASGHDDEEEEDDEAEELGAAFEEEFPKARKKAAKKEDGPTIVAPIPQARPVRAQPLAMVNAAPKKDVLVPHDSKAFVLPPMDRILDPVPTTRVQIDEKTLRENATKLEEKLASYQVQGRVDEIHPGPVVTMYEFEPAAGTRMSKIASLSDDLALALAAQKVRIVAPIPGKGRVGFELPNKTRQTVSLLEILEDDRWTNMKAALPLALGKDIVGAPVYIDLATTPHMLVAGATGAGKSVGLNVMLASLLSQKTPEEVRLLMIDPKVVELKVFDGIPHMLLPVVTDMQKASLALRWAVDEMERRYQLFADAGARNIGTYNERVEKVLRGEMHASSLAPARVGKVRAQGANGEEVLLDPDYDETSDAVETMPVKLPYIVAVVDEFADLMQVAAKDVETSIARLAQKARAAGIHVILATQRPSVDVITGMIKANFPTRIAFKVAQREDSRTILSTNGAEHLLGKGDMLLSLNGQSDLKRVHCAYVGEQEIEDLCKFLKMQGKPVYDESILKPREDGDGAGAGGLSTTDDPLYDKAVAVVAQAGYCSISHIQRHLKVGYNKAATLVEQMEQEGVVGPASAKAGGRREVLIQAM